MRIKGRMHAPQRHRFIVDRVRERRFATVPELASECSVSKMTMRRDLDYLAKNGLIERTHGGAASTLDADGIDFDLFEPALDTRSRKNLPGKQAIGRKSAALVIDGQTIAIDVGTTTFELALLIADRSVNVYTSSLKIAQHLGQRKPDVYLPPGRVVGTEPSIVGAQAVRHFNQLNFDISFIGVSGVSENGIFDYSIEDSDVKRALITCSQKRAVLLDSSKFNRSSVVRVSGFEHIDLLITDAKPPQNLAEVFAAFSIEVIVAT